MTTLAEIGVQVRARGPAEQRGPCPKCADPKGARDDALSFNVEDGRFHCFRCGWKGRAGGAESVVGPTRITDPGVVERKRERLRKVWRETLPLTHAKAHAAHCYLVARALGDVLKNPPKVLRAHPGLEYWDGTRNVGTFPAMIALFHGAAGSPVTLHCTYLRADGAVKAPVPSPKKVLGVPHRGATKGGAVRLF